MDEWADSNYLYYLKIKILKNPIWGIAIILALAAVTAFMIGRSLSDTVKAVGVMTVQAVPLAIVGLIGLLAIVGFNWYRSSRK